MPQTTSTYDLGSSSLAWNNLFVNNINGLDDIILKSGTIDITTTSNDAVFYPSIVFKDSNGLNAGKLFAVENAGRSTVVGLVSYNVMSSEEQPNVFEEIYGGIYITMDYGGDMVYTVTQEEKFRQALNLIGPSNNIGYYYEGRDFARIKTTEYNGFDALLSFKTTDGSWELGAHSNNQLLLNYITDTDYNGHVSNATTQFKFDANGDFSCGYVRANGMSSTDSNGLLVYKPANWSGVSSTQWGVGAANCQGVIRSNNNALVHYKGGTAYEIIDASGGTLSGNLVIAKNDGSSFTARDTGNNNLQVQLAVNAGHQNHGVYSNGYAPSASTFTSSGKWIIYRNSSGDASTGLKLYGAVWNDYAEFRKGEVTEGGYCVTETSSGKMLKTIKRLQPGCKITSDTFGFAIGKTEEAKTPIAVCGRVLVYTYRNRDEYPLGAAVCSAPNGTVDIMTREEIREYPERIIGTVSEIPDYEIWHGGTQEGDEDVSVNGRIWIYVR